MNNKVELYSEDIIDIVTVIITLKKEAKNIIIFVLISLLIGALLCAKIFPKKYSFKTNLFLRMPDLEQISSETGSFPSDIKSAYIIKIALKNLGLENKYSLSEIADSITYEPVLPSGLRKKFENMLNEGESIDLPESNEYSIFIKVPDVKQISDYKRIINAIIDSYIFTSFQKSIETKYFSKALTYVNVDDIEYWKANEILHNTSMQILGNIDRMKNLEEYRYSPDYISLLDIKRYVKMYAIDEIEVNDAYIYSGSLTKHNNIFTELTNYKKLSIIQQNKEIEKKYESYINILQMIRDQQNLPLKKNSAITSNFVSINNTKTYYFKLVQLASEAKITEYKNIGTMNFLSKRLSKLSMSGNSEEDVAYVISNLHYVQNNLNKIISMYNSVIDNYIRYVEQGKISKVDDLQLVSKSFKKRVMLISLMAGFILGIVFVVLKQSINKLSGRT